MNATDDSQLLTVNNGDGRKTLVRVKARQYMSEHVDTGQIHASDKGYMDEIIVGLLSFDETLPLLKIKVIAPPHSPEYILVIDNWSSPIMTAAFFHRFEDPKERDPKYNLVKYSRMVPKTGQFEVVVTRASADQKPARAAIASQRRPPVLPSSSRHQLRPSVRRPTQTGNTYVVREYDDEDEEDDY